MKPEGSLPSSQEPTIESYSDPAQSNTRKIIFLLSSHLRLGLPSDHPLCARYLPYTSRYLFDHPNNHNNKNNIWWRVTNMKLHHL